MQTWLEKNCIYLWYLPPKGWSWLEEFMLHIFSVKAGTAIAAIVLTGAEIRINRHSFSMHMLKCFKQSNSPFTVCITKYLACYYIKFIPCWCSFGLQSCVDSQADTVISEKHTLMFRAELAEQSKGMKRWCGPIEYLRTRKHRGGQCQDRQTEKDLTLLGPHDAGFKIKFRVRPRYMDQERHFKNQSWGRIVNGREG
jgi:hypothetical protein